MGNNQSDEEGRNQKGNQELYRDKNHTALKHRHKDPIPVKSTACSSDEQCDFKPFSDSRKHTKKIYSETPF